MKSKKWLIIILVVIFLIVAGIFIWYYFFQEEEEEITEFELDTLFLKVAIRKGGEAISNVKITNIGDRPKHFLTGIREMRDAASIKEEKFSLFPNEEYTIEVNFSAKDTFPGVHLGQLEIFSDKESKAIPIILEIQSETVLFDSNMNLFPTGADILPGQKLSAEIKIFDLANIGTSNIEVIYHIKDFTGKTIFSETENLIIDNTFTFTKTLNLPPNLRDGDYVFITIVKYDGSVGTSSMFFNVGGETKKRGGELFSEKNIFYVAFGSLFLVFLVLLIYALFSKERLLEELQSQYKKELRKQGKLIKEQEKIDYSKLKTPIEKKEYKKEIKKIRKQRQKALKKMHEKRLEKYRKIEKTGKKKKLEKQFRKWKKEGYDTSNLEKKYKFPRINEIRNKIKKWKAEGYNIGTLERKLEKGRKGKKK